jgi:long-chain acyl-CoA synthetase
LGKPIDTVPALLQARAELSPQAPALWELRGPQDWQSMSWRQFRDAVESSARGLRALGLRHGDTVGIIAPSSARWDIAQFAAMAAGGVVVGLDPHDTDERLAAVAAQCRLKLLIAHDEAALAKLAPPCRISLRFEVTFSSPLTTGAVAFSDLPGIGSAPSGSAKGLVEADDAALIVFTSGTTGEPKGIVYTHVQVCSAIASILQAFPDINAGSRLACWLPLSNLFQRMINLCAVGRGAQVFYVEDPRTVMQHVQDIAPSLFIGVPRFYEKLYAGIREAIDARPAWQRSIVEWAIRAGDRHARQQRQGVAPGWLGGLVAALADRFVLRRIRSVMGRDLRYLISGSAPMPTWLLERFHALGLLVLEAYGMSECIVPVALNRPQSYKFGTVGKALAGSEVRLAVDGELLIRGSGVFSGYLEDPAGADRFDVDGFLASGDYAHIDDDGFIMLLGRKSEMIKTSTGRRIAPTAVESQLRQVAYVEHAVVLGANRPFLVAVIAVDEAALRDRLGENASAIVSPATADAVRADLAAALSDLPAYLHPAGLVLTTRLFSVADGLITPNLKVRRASVESTFGAWLDELYGAIGRGAAKPFALVREGGTVVLLST